MKFMDVLLHAGGKTSTPWTSCPKSNSTQNETDFYCNSVVNRSKLLMCKQIVSTVHGHQSGYSNDHHVDLRETIVTISRLVRFAWLVKQLFAIWTLLRVFKQ